MGAALVERLLSGFGSDCGVLADAETFCEPVLPNCCRMSPLAALGLLDGKSVRSNVLRAGGAPPLTALANIMPATRWRDAGQARAWVYGFALWRRTALRDVGEDRIGRLVMPAVINGRSGETRSRRAVGAAGSPWRVPMPNNKQKRPRAVVDARCVARDPGPMSLSAAPAEGPIWETVQQLLGDAGRSRPMMWCGPCGGCRTRRSL